MVDNGVAHKFQIHDAMIMVMMMMMMMMMILSRLTCQ